MLVQGAKLVFVAPAILATLHPGVAAAASPSPNKTKRSMKERPNCVSPDHAASPSPRPSRTPTRVAEGTLTPTRTPTPTATPAEGTATPTRTPTPALTPHADASPSPG